MSDLEEALVFHLRREKIGGYVREHPFGGVSGKRKWRFDFAWPNSEPPVAVDCQGGVYLKGRRSHGSPEQMARDSIKQAQANMCGWIFIALTPEMVKDGTGLELVKEALGRTK